jgi:hypothetical protein
MATPRQDTLPVIRDPGDFDARSGNLPGTAGVQPPPAVRACMLLATLVLGYMALTRLELRPSFEKMIRSHPYIQNYLDNRDSLRGLGNSLRVVVENPGRHLRPRLPAGPAPDQRRAVPRPGVDRAWMKSLWSPAVRWTEVTEEGFQGGPVMPDGYQGRPADIDQLRQNIERAGIVGSLVAHDFKSSMLIVPLLDQDSATGKGIDYHAFSQRLEQLRARSMRPAACTACM